MNNRKTPRIRFKGFTDDWEQRKLGDVLRTLPFKQFLKTPEQGGKYEIIQQGNEPIIGYANGEPCESFRNTVIFGDHTLSLYKPKKPFFVATDGVRILQGTNDMDGYYLLSLLEGNSLKSEGYKRYYSILLDREVLLTENHCEQVQIGLCFKHFDHLITLHQRKLEKLKIVKKAMLENCFPKNGEKVPKFRFFGFTGDWEQRKLLDLIIEYKETVDSDCNLPILTSSKTEGVVLQEDHFGRVQNHDITGYNILPRNYCTYRNRSDGVDFTFNINRCCDKGIISKFYPVFYGNNSDIFFISMVLNYCDEVVHEIAYTCTGTGQKVLSFLDLQKMNIRVASYDEQKKISQYFEQLDHLITLHQRKLEKLKIIKKSFLEKMFV